MDPSILVVGNQVLQDLMTKLLSTAQHFVLTTVTNAVDAESAISAQQPDIVISQANDPTSIDLAQRIQQQSRFAWMYQVFVGIMHQDDFLNVRVDAARALEQGADSYFPCFPLKELEREELSGNIDILQNHRRLLTAQIYAGLRRARKDRDLIRANDLLSSIALSDPLTELNNRRAFEWELPRQIQAARLRKAPISLLMLDIDFFKRINDAHGHIVGDQALRMVANRLRHNLRFYDMPFRYGGEEFSIILNNTPSQESIQIGQRICSLIAQQPFVISPSLQLDITISIGSASLKTQDDDRGLSLLHRADQNLLLAKDNGRNQLVGDTLTEGETYSNDSVRSEYSAEQVTTSSASFNP